MNPIFVIALSAVLMALVVASPIELTEEQKMIAKGYSDKCAKEVNLTEEEMSKVKAKDFKNPTENMKCFANCFFEKTNFLKEGVIQSEVIRVILASFIGEEKTRDALDKCSSIKEKNNCDTALKLHECLEEFSTKD